jgi:hypothetical protein
MSRTLSDEELESLFITPQDTNVEADAYADGGDDEADHSDGEGVIIDGRYRAYERYASLTTGTTRPN